MSYPTRKTVMSIKPCLFALIAAGSVLAGTLPSSAAPSGESIEQREARLKWFKEARFGMFIHWGVYDVPAGIWQDKEVRGIGEWILKNG